MVNEYLCRETLPNDAVSQGLLTLAWYHLGRQRSDLASVNRP